MITPLRSLDRASSVFSLHELPNEAQQPVLRDLVIPRVMSFSMEPMLQAQDRLELGPADPLQVGDLVLFRWGSHFVCHRLASIDDDRLSTKGDACTGPPQQILRSDVLGRVTAIVRQGVRLGVPPLLSCPEQQPDHMASRPWMDETRERIRVLLRRWLSDGGRLPVIGQIVRGCASQLLLVEVLELAPLRSLPSYVTHRTFRLSQISSLHDYLCAMRRDPSGIVLILRLASLYMGTCSLAPWSLHIRPAAAALGLERPLESLQRRMKSRVSG